MYGNGLPVYCLTQTPTNLLNTYFSNDLSTPACNSLHVGLVSQIIVCLNPETPIRVEKYNQEPECTVMFNGHLNDIQPAKLLKPRRLGNKFKQFFYSWMLSE